MIPPPPTEEEIAAHESGQQEEMQAAPVEAFPVERVTDDEVARFDEPPPRSRRGAFRA